MSIEISPLEMNKVERDLLESEKRRLTDVLVPTETLRALLDENKRLLTQLQSISATDDDDDEDDWVDDDEDNDPWMEDDRKCECDRCGGDGHVELAEAPELWGEDTMSEKNRLVECPDCDGIGWVLQ